MIEKNILVNNRLGLHARPSALLVKTATRFRSEFHIEKDGMKVNGKSIMGVMMLAAECGSELSLIIDGPDEAYLLEELEELFNTKFGEE
ncbi:MAG: phosphocarrier protein HPr [Candidatus Cloacimonetes bacterium 4572_65]|nr:MAG: phosphocarrier protein HPr [Candidatus Cloacimonetes bacterium 4572_65]